MPIKMRRSIEFHWCIQIIIKQADRLSNWNLLNAPFARRSMLCTQFLSMPVRDDGIYLSRHQFCTEIKKKMNNLKKYTILIKNTFFPSLISLKLLRGKSGSLRVIWNYHCSYWQEKKKLDQPDRRSPIDEINKCNRIHCVFVHNSCV